VRDALRAAIGWAIFLCVGITHAQPIAVPAKQQHVLVIHVSTPGAPGPASFDAVYQKILGDTLGSGLDLHREYIDLASYSEPDYPAALVGFLRYKYQRLPPDVVLAVSEGAHRFIQRFRTELFPGIPIVFIDRPTARRQSQETGISTPLDLAGTLDLALLLQPATRRVFVVTGVSELDRMYGRVAREQFQRLASRVTLTFLSDLAWADLEKTVAHLPPDSIIYFLTFAEDGAGARLPSTESGDRLARVANVPIYSWKDVMMDHGIIGGRLLSNEIVAEHSAQLTLRLLRGEKPDSIPVLAVDPYVPQLDWRQLRHWGISEARVPDGTTILYRELSFWDRYKVYVAGALVLTLLQTTLIAGLLVQRGRRRRIEAALREHHATLQARNQQISDLFGRLIAAQETERTRIARDLHDDVSQRIAALSIMVSGLQRRLRGRPDDADVVSELATMQRSANALAEQIRHVSHDLHPASLQHLGLVVALRGFCGEFEKLQAVAVTYNANPDIGPVDVEIALCLYRVAQEVLRNVAKHAGARQVGVELVRTADRIELTIADDGKGFDLVGTRVKGPGLGLVSIDERVRLLGGRVRIDTQPQGGTQVQVRIPLSGESRPPHNRSSDTVVSADR
jgi:signal transduction histidine kinase